MQSIVSVIESTAPGNLNTHHFPDTPEGNQKAEACFRRLMGEQQGDSPDVPRFHYEEIDEAITEGYAETPDGWQLYLTHGVIEG